MGPADAGDVFLTLTPDRVLEAVEAAGLRCRALCYPLNSFENRVYEVELEDRSRLVAKFYRPRRWSRAAILAEHGFLAELAEAEVPVCPVRPFPDGSTLKEIEGIHYALWDRRGGRAPDELGDELVLRLGRLVARMHEVGARRGEIVRPRLGADYYARRQIRWLRENDVLPGHLRQRYLDCAAEIADQAEARMAGSACHRIHADLHLGNLLERDGQLFLLDFDDFCTGPPVQDLWLALPGRGPATRRQRELFLAGYEEFRDFDRTSLALVESLRGLRLVRYTTWLARRWTDPAFRMAWPDFGTDEYWFEETEALERQLEVIREEPEVDTPERSEALIPPPAEEELALTNKDYFWDWEGD